MLFNRQGRQERQGNTGEVYFSRVFYLALLAVSFALSDLAIGLEHWSF